MKQVEYIYKIYMKHIYSSKYFFMEFDYTESCTNYLNIQCNSGIDKLCKNNKLINTI